MAAEWTLKFPVPQSTPDDKSASRLSLTPVPELPRQVGLLGPMHRHARRDDVRIRAARLGSCLRTTAIPSRSPDAPTHGERPVHSDEAQCPLNSEEAMSDHGLVDLRLPRTPLDSHMQEGRAARRVIH